MIVTILRVICTYTGLPTVRQIATHFIYDVFMFINCTVSQLNPVFYPYVSFLYFSLSHVKIRVYKCFIFVHFYIVSNLNIKMKEMYTHVWAISRHFIQKHRITYTCQTSLYTLRLCIRCTGAFPRPVYFYVTVRSERPILRLWSENMCLALLARANKRQGQWSALLFNY